MKTILKLQHELANHPLYRNLIGIEALRSFMSMHVYAVWDFMSLLKSLQTKLTCVDVPWRPSPYPAEIARLINEIVLEEESDLDQAGRPISHFNLYLESMEEVGASTLCIREFLTAQDINAIPHPAQDFVRHTLNVAKYGHVIEIAAYFFFGREKLIPDIFQSIVHVLQREKIEAPTFLYYLKRHIEIDGSKHGPLALRCLDVLASNDEKLKSLALQAGERALLERKRFWDAVAVG